MKGDIVYQDGDYYVVKAPKGKKGWLIYRHEGTAAVQAGIVAIEGDKGWETVLRQIEMNKKFMAKKKKNESIETANDLIELCESVKS